MKISFTAAILFNIFLIINLLLPVEIYSTEDYADNTGQSCLTCHISVDGGSLNETGRLFQQSRYKWPVSKKVEPYIKIKNITRFILGLVHIIASFIWFGTILYVHIVLRPAYASQGLPKQEVRLGMVSMLAVGISGLFLTLSRLGSIQQLFTGSWGILLSIKIAIFIFMFLTALCAVFFIGPRLKAVKSNKVSENGGFFDPDTLLVYNGRENAKALIAYREQVYDVTGSELWKDGLHMRHLAGNDLTRALDGAPHGEEKLEKFRIIGRYDSTGEKRLTGVQKGFYIIAYVNLGLVFIALFVISLWIWGL